MEKFGKSQPVKRTEDQRFLTGHGRYMDDDVPEDALFAAFYRSPVAHGRITALDLDAAREAEGVRLVMTLDDLSTAGIDTVMNAATVQNRDGSQTLAPDRHMLAQDRVRFVGEPVAVVIADTLLQARDAVEMIWMDTDDLPAKLDVEAGGEPLHDQVADNRAFDWGLGDEAATDAAFQAAAHTVSLDVADNRVIITSIEPRGCQANWVDGRLHFAYGGQGVWAMRAQLAQKLKLEPEAIRVTTPDVGGGFGMKVMPYPEYFCVSVAAMKLGQPVHWMSDRSEAMQSDHHGRDLTSLAELAFDEDLKITAYRVHSKVNLGAYSSHFGQAIQTSLFSKVLMGVYDVQTTYLRVEGFYTNTTQVDAYRGAGRPEAIYVLERVMDRAARHLGVDPWELRRRNFIRPENFPYKTATGEIYDVGDFDMVLSRADIQTQGFATRKTADAERGLIRGRGLCYYIESILGDPSENAKVEFCEDGTVNLYVGTQSNGQGHETVYAQFLSDQTGVPMDQINVVQGDSDQLPHGGGTGGSRSVTVQSTATLATIDVMIAAFTPYLADKMGVEESDVRFDHETFRAPGSNLTPTLSEAAEMARADGRADLLSHEASANLDARSYPNGAHVAEVVIDSYTGETWVDQYTIVDDFGNLINPMLAEGQVHGGVVQGIGQALTECVVHDAQGQLLTASLMDYALPRAAEIPMIKFTSAPVPSTSNPMGMKGCGEAGTVGALAAVANAVQDALWDHGVRQADMPFTPHKVWELLTHGSVAAE
ncbi:xanthine dehydrogenase family protein molybdopterin-binding subunit [Ruegeria sp. A3M17]|uniref:xanthine dehydrogenase family protein molybdopterin-binding subunit n=1 Tax=Ruegeria sp. A3M17 TaxID=2267229 RepID=UPI000DEA2BDC|nr:xanthine dehydrogenase family protein molybdopterin-binding subunit [Ruegeria sp. A3M17]RBW56247.1 xanthine dehydrogenase family protein molybdopterin-binding subunit [Ruegeria sp. A3M17]